MLRRYFTVDMLSFLPFGVLHVLDVLSVGGGGRLGNGSVIDRNRL